jgi:hypothetical protein
VQDGPSSASAAPGAAAVPSSGEPGAEVVAEPDAPSSEARDAAAAEPSGAAARPFAALSAPAALFAEPDAVVAVGGQPGVAVQRGEFAAGSEASARPAAERASESLQSA